MAVIGCYSIDLYCDAGGEEYGGKCPHKYILATVQFQAEGRNERECLAKARKAGWKISRDKRRATCPGCAGSKQTIATPFDMHRMYTGEHDDR